MLIKNNSLNLFLITLVAYFCGLTNVFLLELISYFCLFIFVLKNTKKYWLSKEGLFVIFFSLITIPFIIDEPTLFYNHFKQLILTLAIITFSINLKPLSSRFLSLISIINFIIVFLQVNFDTIIYPSIFFQGSYTRNLYERGEGFRAVGILVGSHPSTFIISLASLALFYANKESLNSLIKSKLTTKNLFLIFIFFINFLSLYLSWTYTSLIALGFQFFIIFGNQIFLVKFFKNFFNRIYLNFIGLKINFFLIFIPIILILITFNFNNIEFFVLEIFEKIVDGRAIASLGIITAQFKSLFDILFGLSIFPQNEIIVNTTLGEGTQRIFSLAEVTDIGLEIGYFKILYSHGLIIGFYLLTFLFRKLYGIRTFMFFVFLHYAHLTTNPLVLIMAITASKYAKINSKEMVP